MTIPPGAYEFGPANATLRVMTYKGGAAARVGHDLTIEATEWDARLTVAEVTEDSTLTLTADPAALKVREGRNGVTPLIDLNRRDIQRNIKRKILGTEAIEFRSTAISELPRRKGLAVEGELTLAGRSAVTDFTVSGEDARQLSASATLIQSEWGIKPYVAMLGALRVADNVDVLFEAREA